MTFKNPKELSVKLLSDVRQDAIPVHTSSFREEAMPVTNAIKRRLIIGSVLSAVILTGCVSRSDYDALQTQNRDLQANNQQLVLNAHSEDCNAAAGTSEASLPQFQSQTQAVGDRLLLSPRGV